MQKPKKPAGDIRTCPIAKFAAIFESKWAIIILRDLFWHGDQRFKDFKSHTPTITDRALTQSLKHLQGLKLIERVVQDTSPPSVVYRLTPCCRDMQPVFKSMVEWGNSKGKKWWNEIQGKFA